MLSERIFFVIEGITNILKLDVKNGFDELQKELSRAYDFLKDFEAKYDNQGRLLEWEQQFYLSLRSTVDFCDDFLDCLTAGNVVAGKKHDLVERIQNSYKFLAVQPIFNVNFPGHQVISMPSLYLSQPDIKKNSRPKSYGHYPNSLLVGFDHEIQILLDHLLQPHDKTTAVGVVGMGGCGKTALVKHIYHLPSITTHFTHKIWVCISQTWDKTSILNQIWAQVAPNPTDQQIAYDLVVQRLYQLLSSSTYLLIIDDIWSTHAWFDISPALPYQRGSRVVFTTRKKAISLHIDPEVLIVEPKKLTDKESYELFERSAFLPNESIPDHLLRLGKEMVKKCEGIPLAIIALASILKMEKRPSNWERINLTLMDRILNTINKSTQGYVQEILELSYDELPSYLKPCVLYLRFFPQNCEIEAQKLVRLWIAECFVDDEYVGEEYIEEMARQSLVQVVKTNFEGRVHKFRTHELIRQMLVNRNKKRGPLEDEDTFRLAPMETLYGDEEGSCDFFMKALLCYNSHVRSLILLNLKDCWNLELQRLFTKFRLLRVLILNQIPMKELPEEIGSLIHLRYLELSGNSSHLPRSIGNLENLWTIDIRNLDTSMVQINLEKLKEVRHLYMPMRKFEGHALGGEINLLKLERLKKLKTLWGAKGDMWMSSGMQNLSAGLQRLCVLDIKSKEQLEALFRTQSITLNNLRTLELMWYPNPVKLSNMSTLSKCKSLRKLKLVGRLGESEPLVLPPNLVKLEMAYTQIERREVMKEISDSSPLLRILVLRKEAYMGSELVCGKNYFLQLEKLKLEFLSNIKRWIIEESAMPSLNHLTINGCENMDLDPQGLTRISMIPQLEGHFPRKLKQKLLSIILVISELKRRPPRKSSHRTAEGIDSSHRTSISTSFRYDVVRITILAISCLFLSYLYFWFITGYPPRSETDHHRTQDPVHSTVPQTIITVGGDFINTGFNDNYDRSQTSGKIVVQVAKHNS